MMGEFEETDSGTKKDVRKILVEILIAD